MASIQYSNSAIGNFTYGWDANHNKMLRPANLSGLGTSLGLKWDLDNKLRAADTNNDGTDDVLYLWDALGRRVGRTASGITTVYFQNGEQTLADYTLGALPSSPTYTYLWGGYIDELVMRTSTGGNHYFHRNQQYSVTAVTTSTGAVAERYAYSPYGELTILNASATPIASSAIGNRYTYTGREWDATLGLYHFRARFMSPTAGRFLGRDPEGYIDGFNVYLSGIKLSSLDPSGRTQVTISSFCPEWTGTSGCFENCAAAGISLEDCTYICAQQDPPERWGHDEWKDFPGVRPGHSEGELPTGFPGIDVVPPTRPTLPIVWGEELSGLSDFPSGTIDASEAVRNDECVCRERYLYGSRTRPKSKDGTFPNPGISGECSNGTVVIMRYPGECKGKRCSGACYFYYKWVCSKNCWASAGHHVEPCR